MFRILFLTIVTLSFASIVHAGLDTFNCECELITAFRFESTKANEDLTTYTEDSGPQGHTGSLLNGASLSNDGKYGKCLHLRGDAIFGSGTTIVPLAGNYEFSIAAWIKLPRQRHSSFKLYVKGEHTDDDSIINFHLLVVKTDGNLLGVHDAGEDTDFSIETNDQNVSDNEWHHIAYTKTLATYRLFIDGEVAAEVYKPLLQFRFFKGNQLFTLLGTLNTNQLTGNVYVDDLVTLSVGLSAYEVKGLYNDGITGFLETMPVDPQGKVATTWSKLKSQ